MIPLNLLFRLIENLWSVHKLKTAPLCLKKKLNVSKMFAHVLFPQFENHLCLYLQDILAYCPLNSIYSLPPSPPNKHWGQGHENRVCNSMMLMSISW